MVDSWLVLLTIVKYFGIALVDLKEAFDLADHQVLLFKLELYGIEGEALLLSTSYLSQRRQQVSVNNTKSDKGGSLWCFARFQSINGQDILHLCLSMINIIGNSHFLNNKDVFFPFCSQRLLSIKSYL